MVMVLMMVLVVMVMMVHRSSGICLIDQVPPAHTQVLTVGVGRQAWLAIAHKASWSVAKRVGLGGSGEATSVRRHVEGVGSTCTGSTHLHSSVASGATADPAHRELMVSLVVVLGTSGLPSGGLLANHVLEWLR